MSDLDAGHISLFVNNSPNRALFSAPSADVGTSVKDDLTKDDENVTLINVRGEMPNALKPQAVKIRDSIKLWQAWMHLRAGQAITEKVKEGKLSDSLGDDDSMKRANFRAKVLHTMMEKSTWFAAQSSEQKLHKIDCKKAEFHLDILQTVLSGLSAPGSIISKLDEILTGIGKNIELKAKKTKVRQTRWVMLAVLSHDKTLDIVVPQIRTVYFDVSDEMSTYTVHKASYEEVHFRFSYGELTGEFVPQVWTMYEPTALKALGGEAPDWDKPLDVDPDE